MLLNTSNDIGSFQNDHEGTPNDSKGRNDTLK